MGVGSLYNGTGSCLENLELGTRWQENVGFGVIGGVRGINGCVHGHNVFCFVFGVGWNFGMIETVVFFGASNHQAGRTAWSSAYRLGRRLLVLKINDRTNQDD